MIKNYQNVIIQLLLLCSFQPTYAWAQNPDAELTNQETNIVVRNDKLYKTLSFEIQINNRAGEKHTEVSIPYSKMNKVSKIEACIKDIHGTIIKKLKNGDITLRSAIADFSLYEDDFVKEFTLKHNIYPYTLCYSYQSQEDEFLYLDHWLPVIESDVPTSNATLILEVPTGYKIAYSSRLVDSFKTDTIETGIKYTWKASYNRLIESEIYSPVTIDFLPNVFIVPEKFNYEQSGSFSSWLSYGNWQYRLIEGLTELPTEEKAKIRSLIQGITDEKEQIKILYHYLQDATRYINITIETGGLKPYPASYVAENKYGDCKALTNYFRSVLQFIGIQSYYTKVWAGDQIKEIDKTLPSQQFNHAILYVPLATDTLWLDCTSDGPFNKPGTFTQNRDAFIVDNEQSHFAHTPALLKEDVREIRKIMIISGENNTGHANFKNIYRGETFETLFFVSRGVSESKKSQIVRNNFIESGFELSEFSLVPSARDSSVISLNYSAISTKVFKKYGKEILIRNIPFSIPPFKEPKYRTLPVKLDYPIFKTDTLEYEIPVGYAVTGALTDEHISTEFGEYELKSQHKGSKVIIIKHFLLNSGIYSVEKYKSFYDFVHKVNGIENNTYIVTTK